MGVKFKLDKSPSCTAVGVSSMSVAIPSVSIAGECRSGPSVAPLAPGSATVAPL